MYHSVQNHKQMNIRVKKFHYILYHKHRNIRVKEDAPHRIKSMRTSE